MSRSISKFDYEGFTGEYPVVVSKQRYTKQEAIEIAKREIGVDEVSIVDGYVRYCYGKDDNDLSDKARNTWWLTLSKGCPIGCCPVWAFKAKED